MSTPTSAAEAARIVAAAADAMQAHTFTASAVIREIDVDMCRAARIVLDAILRDEIRRAAAQWGA